jgi:hypothetical protein
LFFFFELNKNKENKRKKERKTRESFIVVFFWKGSELLPPLSRPSSLSDHQLSILQSHPISILFVEVVHRLHEWYLLIKAKEKLKQKEKEKKKNNNKPTQSSEADQYSSWK